MRHQWIVNIILLRFTLKLALWNFKKPKQLQNKRLEANIVMFVNLVVLMVVQWLLEVVVVLMVLV